MKEKQIPVTFQPANRTVFVLPGTSLMEAAGRAGLVLDAPCGGAGTCGKCRVRITSGAAPPTTAETALFADNDLDAGWRLACQSTVSSALTIEIPPASLFGAGHQIVDASSVSTPRDVVPGIRKVYVELPGPTLEDPKPDLLRLEEQTGPFELNLSALRRVPEQLRSLAYQGTAVFSEHQLIDFEAGDTTRQCYAIAFDIGTTTMVGALIDLCSGQEIATLSRMNPQVPFGDDVLARIRHSSSCTDCLTELRDLLIEETGAMIGALCQQAGISSSRVYEVGFAGNTTMQHLLCGMNVARLGEVPFAPAYARGLRVTARDMELPVNPRGIGYVFPVIGGFVGGDTVAGMLATELDDSDRTVLMIDIGTNGEIVLAHRGELRAASTAAGPAFEGARISCGMRATHGAIEKVILEDDVRLGVIGNVPPAGICGSGLIDLMAELRRCEIVSPEGRLRPQDDLPDTVAGPLAARIRVDNDGQAAFLVAAPGEHGARDPVYFRQRDIRELQLGCGAIRAGIRILLKAYGLNSSQLDRILIAGGFGSFVRCEHAQRIGLIPVDVVHNRIQYVGNVSLAGVRWAMLSADARRKAEALARRTRHVELSVDPDFQVEFADAMLFPENDLESNRPGNNH